MKKIVVGFSRSKKCLPLGSWAIRLWQSWSPYSHCYIKLLTTPSFPSNKILHAAEGQVSHYSETAFLKRNKVIEEFELEIPIKTYNSVKRDLFHELAGEPYSVLQNIGIVYVAFMRVIGISVKNPWTQGWNCSEYVTKVLQETHPDLVSHLDPNTVLPSDIYKVLKSLR